MRVRARRRRQARTRSSPRRARAPPAGQDEGSEAKRSGRTHLGHDAGMLNHGPCVGREATHGAANVRVDLHDLLDRVGLEQGRLGALLDGEDDAVGGLDPDGRRAELCFACVGEWGEVRLRGIGGGEGRSEGEEEGEAHLDGLDGVLDWWAGRGRSVPRSDRACQSGAHPGRGDLQARRC